MARIEGIPEERAGWMTQFAYRYARRHYGKVLEPLKVAAHHAWVSRGAGAFELALARARRVDHRLKALASIKAAALIGCPF